MTDPASQHPYMYCGGNPIRYSDPSGYVAVADDLIILGAAVIGAVALKAYQAGKEGTRAIARGIGSLWKATTTGAKVVGHNWSLGIEQIRVDTARYITRPIQFAKGRGRGGKKQKNVWPSKLTKMGKSRKNTTIDELKRFKDDRTITPQEFEKAKKVIRYLNSNK